MKKAKHEGDQTHDPIWKNQVRKRYITQGNPKKTTPQEANQHRTERSNKQRRKATVRVNVPDKVVWANKKWPKEFQPNEMTQKPSLFKR